MKLGRRGLWIVCAGLLAAWPAPAAGPLPAPMPAATPSKAAPANGTALPTEPVAEVAIPVAEIATRAEVAVIWLRRLAPDLEARADLGRFEEKIKGSGALVWEAVQDTRALQEEGPRLSILEGIEAGWNETRQQIDAQSATLTARAQDAEKALAELKAARERWLLTDQAARDSDAPASVLGRIEDVEREIDHAREQILTLRERILSLQDQAARLVAISDEVLASLARYRRETVEKIGVPSSRPLWNASLRDGDRHSAAQRFVTETARELEHSRLFLLRRSNVFSLQIFIFGVLVLLFRTARVRAARWVQRDLSLRDALGVLEFPYSAALVLTLISSLWLHPELPRLLVNAVSLLSFLPVLRILRRLVHPRLLWLVYTFAGFFFVDRVRDLVATAPLLEQLVLVAEMTAGLGIMLWILRPGRLRGLELAAHEVHELRLLSGVERLLAVAFAGALGAAVMGYMQLARFLAFSTLGAVYSGMALYAAARAARGLSTFLLRVRPLSTLRMVQRHRDLLEQRVGRGIGWLAGGLWILAMVSGFEVLGVSGESVSEILAADLSFGALTLSLGEILAFGITVWAAFLISRFTRFVLGEEVYPRLALAHGAPYAISSLVHYAILLGGFLLALAGMGLDLNRFTVLGGAFGVGIGFGLQTIVNNFVSGLILLFERPIQIGDTVQLSDIIGEVKRIGIRSSTIRTSSGAEVIVPNSSLISERVTNWTLSDRSRRFEIAVGVAYGTRLADVLALLADVAKKHPEVLPYPEPTALFIRFGESSIDFELRVWVVDGDRLPVVKTEIAVALTDAFAAAGIEIPFPQREVRLVERRKGE